VLAGRITPRSVGWHAVARQAGPACVVLACLLCTAVSVAQQPSATADPAQREFAVAQRLMHEGDLTKAREAVLEGLRLSPRSVNGLNLLGIIYSQEKDYARSKEAFEQALRIDPRSAATHNNLGNSYVAQNRPDLAGKEFLAALRLDPENRDANYNQGLLALNQRHAEEAIRYFKHVQPLDPSAAMNLLRAELLAGRTDEALRLAGRVSEESKGSVKVHFSLGLLLAGEKLYPQAVHELELADALQPSTFDILSSLGQAYYQNKNSAKAETTLLRALSLKPDSAPALYSLGRVYYGEKKDLDALRALVKAHRLAPQNTDVIFLLARLSMAQNYFEDAIPLLQDGIKIDPKRPDLHAALGDCYFTVGKTDQAIQEFQTLIDLAPTAGSYAFMGLAYRHLARHDEARKYLLKGLEIDPRNAACLFNLGYIEARQGDLAPAQAHMELALKAKPDYDDALIELATVKMKQKKYEEALPLLRRSVEITKNRSEVYYKLATTERALHQTEAAARDFKIFETMAKNTSRGPYPFQRLFDYLDQQTGLAPRERAMLDLAGLQTEVAKRPDEPRDLYLLAEAYLKLGQIEDASRVIEHLDEVSGGDFRTALGVGVLFARYHLAADAIRHFKMALAADPSSDDAKYDLADAYFEEQNYAEARAVLDQFSPQGRGDVSYLALLADTDTRLGRLSEAQAAYRKVIEKSPDNELHYLSMALSQLRGGDTRGAEQTLALGRSRIPDSGRIVWGMGVLAVMKGNSKEAEGYFVHALELLPEWPSAYSALAVLYFDTGQLAKTREIFERYQTIFPRGPFDTSRIETEMAEAGRGPQSVRDLSPQMQSQFLALAFALSDQGWQ